MFDLGNHAPSFQVIEKLLPGAVEPCLDGADRLVDRDGDLVIRQTLLVEQHENRPVVDAERREVCEPLD